MGKYGKLIFHYLYLGHPSETKENFGWNKPWLVLMTADSNNAEKLCWSFSYQCFLLGHFQYVSVDDWRFK